MDVTAAMLADAAAVQGGKLYIHGGGWNAISVESLPVTHPSMAFAWVFRVEYAEALQDIQFVVELLDEDDTPLDPRLEAAINVGHPPGSRRGDPTFVPFQWTLPLLTLPRVGGYRFRIRIEDRELVSVPFRVIQRR
jgi:hypothetical protein